MENGTHTVCYSNSSAVGQGKVVRTLLALAVDTILSRLSNKKYC